MKKFCTKCGTQKKDHPVERFDEKTGKQEFEDHCPNIKCEAGCEYHGHQWGGLFENTCRRCGYENFDYY